MLNVLIIRKTSTRFNNSKASLNFENISYYYIIGINKMTFDTNRINLMKLKHF